MESTVHDEINKFYVCAKRVIRLQSLKIFYTNFRCVTCTVLGNTKYTILLLLTLTDIIF